MEVATLKLKHQNKIETANVTYFNLYWKYFEIIHKHYFVKSEMINPYTKKNGSFIVQNDDEPCDFEATVLVTIKKVLKIKTYQKSF